MPLYRWFLLVDGTFRESYESIKQLLKPNTQDYCVCVCGWGWGGQGVTVVCASLLVSNSSAAMLSVYYHRDGVQ